jgi:hypothetical protein
MAGAALEPLTYRLTKQSGKDHLRPPRLCAVCFTNQKGSELKLCDNKTNSQSNSRSRQFTMGTSKKWLCEATDPTVKKTSNHRSSSLPRRSSCGSSSSNEDEEDDVLNLGSMHSAHSMNVGSMHSAHSKHTMATMGSSTGTSNAAWSMDSLVPTNDEGKHPERFCDSFVLCAEDGGANPWWEDLDSPCKTSRETTTRPSAACKPSSDRPKSSSKSPSKSSRSSSKPDSGGSNSKRRDDVPRSPTRKPSGRSSDDKDRAIKSPRREEKESRSRRRTSSKSPKKQRPEVRRCLSDSSIKDIPSIDLAGPSESMLDLGPKNRAKSHRTRKRSSVSPPRRVTKKVDEEEPVSQAAKAPVTKRREHSTSRPASSNADRKEKPASSRRAPRTENSSRQSRNVSPNRTQRAASPNSSRVRIESPVRTRKEAVEDPMLSEAGRSSPKKSRSSPVKESRRTKDTSRRMRSATTTTAASTNHEKTEDDVLDFIAAQIRHLEESTDLAIEFTIRRPEGHRRSSFDSAAIAAITKKGEINDTSSPSDGPAEPAPAKQKAERRRNSLHHHR